LLYILEIRVWRVGLDAVVLWWACVNVVMIKYWEFPDHLSNWQLSEVPSPSLDIILIQRWYDIYARINQWDTLRKG
jgi:hypothetical protein